VSDCPFCKIVRGEIPATIVARTDDALAFSDLNPQAPTHVLVIPTRHAENLGDFVRIATPHEVGAFFGLAATIGRQAGGDGPEARGYRIVANEGRDGGQTVAHLHVHVLAGRRLGWPPG